MIMDNDLIKKIHDVYTSLSDKESKEIFINRLCFSVTGDYKFIREIITKYVPDMAALNDETIPSLLKSLPENTGYYLYGAGEDAMVNLHYFIHDKRFLGFCDRDKKKQLAGINGYRVISPNELLENADCNIIISSHRAAKEIKKFLIENNVDEKRIYRMSPYMFAAQEQQYFNPDFVKYEENEIFIDAGSLDLSSAIKLSKNCKSLKKVYAFEPDLANIKKCNLNIQMIPNCEVKIIPKAVWRNECTLCFSASSNGSSHIDENADCIIEAVDIDSVIDNSDKVTFIKMDVEGAELNALYGCRNTIIKNMPKLAICIYHKPEDIISIPEYIRSLVPGYKFYIRHHSNNVGETVLYAIP